MNAHVRSIGGRSVFAPFIVAGLTLAVLPAGPAAIAQTQLSESHLTDNRGNPETIEVFHLTAATHQNAAQDLSTTLRNMLSKAKIYVNSTQNTIVVRATAEELEQARKLITELDKPLPMFRITYTITQIEDGKRAGAQRYTLIAVAAMKSDLKEGRRVPVITGILNADTSTATTQVQYVDTGLSISATTDGSNLRTKIEQSAVAEEKSNVNIQDPVIHQSVLEAVAAVTPGKPLVLGSFDVPGTTRRQEVEVAVERVQ